MKRLLQIAVLVGLLPGAALTSFASDLAVLRNGFSIRHERRTIIGGVTRLYVGTDSSSYVDVPTPEIEHFESAPVEFSVAPSRKVEHNQAQAQSAKSVDLNAVVNAASDKYRLDPDLVNSVIKAESGFNVRATSRKGAQGLMQLMPGTASKLGVPNAYDPEANVEGGTRYLRELLERYNFDLIKALAAYNAGPQRVEQYGGLPPYYETHAYVARIVRDFNKKKIAEKSAASQSVARKGSAPKASGQTRVPSHKPLQSNAQNPSRVASTSSSE